MTRFSGRRLCLNLVRVLLISITVLAALVISKPIGAAGEKVVVTWVVGVGCCGTTEKEIAAEEKVIAEFNASHSNIQLVLAGPWITFTVQKASDFLPDFLWTKEQSDVIVGPISYSGQNFTKDQLLSSRSHFDQTFGTLENDLGPGVFMDLKPWLDRNHIDLSSLEPALVDWYKTPEGTTGIPFTVYPTVVYYNRTLFKQAGLAYPPAHFGEKYRMPDGSQVPWNYDTLAHIAQLLTLDRNGHNATSADFDATTITQYGLDFDWNDMRWILPEIQPAPFYNPVTSTIQIDTQWRKAAKWVQEGIWKYHFIPNGTAEANLSSQPGSTSRPPFASGHIAMAITQTWFTCCLTDTAGKLDWDIGVVPASFDGAPHVLFDADGFVILHWAKHPDEDFTALMYLLNEAAPQLIPVYRVFAARPAYQHSWFDSQNKIYPQGVNWNVVTESLKQLTPASLHPDSYVPHFEEIQNRWTSFGALLYGDQGSTIDTNVEIDRLQADLQAIANATATPVPTQQP